MGPHSMLQVRRVAAMTLPRVQTCVRGGLRAMLIVGISVLTLLMRNTQNAPMHASTKAVRLALWPPRVGTQPRAWDHQISRSCCTSSVSRRLQLLSESWKGFTVTPLPLCMHHLV